ncbi:hypothetical protein ACOACQ_15050 [Nocardioides sp. CPCC 206347]|jgi:hypothetical protein|uniref:hypothetical protein n=1 Tax=unclassified Nocardioides TaxID=2615069 RepID=UPI003619ECC7
MNPRDDDEPQPWSPSEHIPADAKRMGLNANVPDGAMLEFAGALDSTKLSHRVVAWVLLAAFATPVVLTLLSLLR